MKKIHYILLILLAIIAVIRVVYEYRIHQEELIAAIQFETRQKAVTGKGGPKVQMAADISEMEKIFNNNLPSCTPVNIALKDNTNYVIYGKEGTKCSFEKYTTLLCIQCLLPQDVADKYSRTSGDVDSYIDDVNNDKDYCKIVPLETTVQTKRKIRRKIND